MEHHIRKEEMEHHIRKEEMEHHIRKEEMASSRNGAGIEQELSRNCEIRVDYSTLIKL